MGSGASRASRAAVQPGCERLSITIHQLEEAENDVQQRYKKERWPQVTNSMPSVQQVVMHFIQPATKAKKCSYVFLAFGQQVRPPTWFSSHPWSMSHSLLVLGLRHLVDRHHETGSTAFWLAAYCLFQHENCRHPPDVVLPALFGSRHLCGIVIHVDSDREVWKRMWCLSEMLAALTLPVTYGKDDFKMSFVAVELQNGSFSSFSLSDHAVGTESCTDRRSSDSVFPLSAFMAHKKLEIHASSASLENDENALLQQILVQSGESAGALTPNRHRAFDAANAVLRKKIGSIAMRLAVLNEDVKVEEALFTNANGNEELLTVLKAAKSEAKAEAEATGAAAGSAAGAAAGALGGQGTPEPLELQSSEVPHTRRDSITKLLGVRLGYLVSDFPVAARERVDSQDPNFHEISKALAYGPTGLGYNRRCPRDGKPHCSIVDALEEGNAQKASHFLSWCWDYRLQMYLETWRQWRDQHPEEGFVWQCFFCNNQYRLQEEGTVVAESLGDIFQNRLLDIKHMVVMLDKFMQPKYLERVWCVYEMYTAAANSEKVSVDIILPPDQAADIRRKIESGAWQEIKNKFRDVHVEHAKARVKSDEDMVKEHIKAHGGFEMVNEKVGEKMREWVLMQVQLFLTDPGTEKSAADFLRAAGLAAYVEKLEEHRIQSFQDLEELEDADLAEIGFDQAERERLLQVVRMGPLGPSAEKDFKERLQALGCPDLQARSEDQVMRDRSIMDKLPTVGGKKKFRKWRQSYFKGEAVAEDVVALDMFVTRGSDWCYDADSDDDLTPEDGGLEGVGRVVAWHSTSGDTAGHLPPRAGWVKVCWQVTGFTRSYRMATVERHCEELVFADEVHALGRSLQEVQKGDIKLHHLRCSFGYRCGTRFPHYALFDARPEACEKVAGFKPGDVVEDKDGDRATCIGLKYRADVKKVDLWFHSNGKEGAGLFTHANHDHSLRKVTQKRVQEVNPEDVEGASDGEIDHDERQWVSEHLQPSLRYRTKAGQLLHFDTRTEIIQRFKMPYKSGDVLLDKADGERMVCIGVACDPMRRLLAEHRRARRRVAGSLAEVWFHVESSEGAGLSPKMHKALSRFTVIHNEPVRELLVEASGDWDMETALGLLASLQGGLQCDFSFPRGAGAHATPDWFDVREDVVYNVVGFKPGSVLRILGASPGTRLTVVGLAPDPDTREVSVWWHHEDEGEMHAGAGKIPGWEHMRSRMQDTGEHVSLDELQRRIASGRRAELRATPVETSSGLGLEQHLAQLSSQLSPADLQQLQQLMGALMR